MSQSHLDVRAYPRTIGFGGGKMHLLGLGIYPTSSAMDCWSWVFLLGICLKQRTMLTTCPFTKGSLLLTKQAAKKQNCLQACGVLNRPWLPHSEGLKGTLPCHPAPLLGKKGKVQSQSESCSVVSDSLQSHGLYSPWNSPGQILEWVAFPFSRGSSQPKDWTHVYRIAGRFFTSWATREAQEYWRG